MKESARNRGAADSKGEKEVLPLVREVHYAGPKPVDLLGRKQERTARHTLRLSLGRSPRLGSLGQLKGVLHGHSISL